MPVFVFILFFTLGFISVKYYPMSPFHYGLFSLTNSYILNKVKEEKDKYMTTRYKGLSEDEVIESRQSHGSNSLLKLKNKSIIRRFFDNLSDPIIKILLIALGIEMIFTFGNCNFIEIIGIVVAILIATVVSTLSEYGSERAFEKIEAEVGSSVVRVIRDGSERSIASDEIVVGDIVRLERGEKIQADGRIIYGQITTDQSALNGENHDFIKRPSDKGDGSLSDEGAVFRGAIITDGSGIMEVSKVGTATYYGMVATDVQVETRISPLKLRLSKLAKQISIIGYIVAVLVGIGYVFNALVVDFGFSPWRISEALKDVKFVLGVLIRALTLMITVVVVAVPEGLPMMITVVLSANMKRMVKDNILVKKLVGIETAGSLNILFTDKTGTLTTGHLAVDRIITPDEICKNPQSLKELGEVHRILALSARYNTECTVSGRDILGGNSTDRAISEFFIDSRVPDISLRDKTPFRSEEKYSSITLTNGEYIIKGAAENILSRSRFFLAPSGEILSSRLSSVWDEYNAAISNGERVIAVAKGDGDALVFVALIVLKDKIRPEVKEAVASVMKAGIQIVMVTGDNRDTAVSIARECGFFKSSGDIALTSGELASLNDDEVKRILPNLRVLARALPQDKTRLVRLSAEMDMVVGMTGDGINDAPSLKLADVGFAMGSGTDIAKSAGDIVILDDSFKSISKTILYGRTIFRSIRKFITFQLIMNLAACGITLIGQILGIDTPITIIQMLWVNIIMDTLGGLAFAAEPPIEYYMLERPKKRDEPILSREMIKHIALNGTFTLLLLVIFLTSGYFKSYFVTTSRQLTAFYALFIFAGIANCFTARSERLFIFNGILKNKIFLAIMLFIIVIQIIIVYFGGAWFRSTPLTLRELKCTVILSSYVWIFDTVRRLIEKLK